MFLKILNKLKNRFLILCVSILSLPILYILISLILGIASINSTEENPARITSFYLNTNGVHLDMIFKKNDLSDTLLKDLMIEEAYRYISFAWGEENFFLHVQEWENLGIKEACDALFFDSPALIHITKYTRVKDKWIEIELSNKQLSTMNSYLHNSFLLYNKKKVHLADRGYYSNDDFYKANGSYTIYYTCNTWVNNAFKECGLKSCVWTAFDFPLLMKYNPEYNFLNNSTLQL